MSLASSSTDIMESAKSLLGVSTQQAEPTALEQWEEKCCSCLPALTWEQRLGGCVSCLIVGLILETGSFFRFSQLMLGNPTPFAVMYTLGNVVALVGSCFLTGPISQVKSMFHTSRYLSSLVYLGTLIITLIIAFSSNFSGQVLLLVLFIIVQFCAMVWYTLSYIPYGRAAVLSTLRYFCKCANGAV